jgi:hypothetical protein
MLIIVVLVAVLAVIVMLPVSLVRRRWREAFNFLVCPIVLPFYATAWSLGRVSKDESPDRQHPGQLRLPF